MSYSLNSIGKCGAQELVLIRELEEEFLLGGDPGIGERCQVEILWKVVSRWRKRGGGERAVGPGSTLRRFVRLAGEG